MDLISMLAAGAAIRYHHGGGEADGQVAMGLPAPAGQLIAWVRSNDYEDTETGVPMPMAMAAPTDHAHIDLLAQVLATRADADPSFAGGCRIGRWRPGAGDMRLTIPGARIHGVVSGEQVSQITGNQCQLRSDDR